MQYSHRSLVIICMFAWLNYFPNCMFWWCTDKTLSNKSSDNILIVITQYWLFCSVNFRGDLCLIVNVAAKWGMTVKNYDQLAKLHAKYADKGLKILLFPCNQFGGQVSSFYSLTETAKLLRQSTLLVESIYFYWTNTIFTGQQWPKDMCLAHKLLWYLVVTCTKIMGF